MQSAEQARVFMRFKKVIFVGYIDNVFLAKYSNYANKIQDPI